MRVSTIVVIILIVGFLLLITALANASAFDYIPNNIYTLEENTIVCVVDPPRKDLFYILKAVNSWDYYMNTDWYTVKVIEIEYLDECDATVLFMNPTVVFDDTQNNFGVTKCWSDAILEQFGATIEKDRYCRAVVDLDTSGHIWYQTLQHEVGHILGLGHRMPFEIKDFPFVFQAHDIMFPMIDNQVTITDESIDALWYFRTYPLLEANYTIPHE